MPDIDGLHLDEATIEDFRADGAVAVRGVATPDEVASLRAGIERNLAEPGPLFGVASPDDDTGRFVEDFCNWDRIPEYGAFVRHSRGAAIAGHLMGAQEVRLHHDHMLVKEPGTRQRTPWHQDQPYYNIDGTQTCSMWLVLDPVDRGSTLTFVAGSHRGPWLMPRTFLSEQAKWFPEGSLADLPDVDGDLARDPAAHRILGWPLEPGDAVFFSMLTLHAAGGVEGPSRRRAFSVRYVGDDVRHAPRRWRTSPEFEGLHDELPAGAPLDHPRFPVLWRRKRLGVSG
ncbi:phytanoyl-CoA dioxygenase family protein [Egicoccus sp. AB-alg6-2]|uniref:phytanoyl-CoA dioxygenase family protein n=1 Tax=Egicoccus sp. AB-alg6-2 TaxID=3242692 RepID=UPI00359ECF6C